MDKINLKFIIPSIGSLIIILGLIKEFVYYQLFGLDILKYIETSEIFLLFAKDIGRIVFFLLIISLLYFFSTNKKQNDYVLFKENWNLKLTERILYFIKDSYNLNFLLLNLFAIRELNLIYKFHNEWEINHFMILYLVIYCFSFIYDEINRHYLIGHNKKIPIFYYYLINASFLMYFLTLGKTYIDYRNIIDNKENKKISFLLENKKISSSKSYLFIGQTKNYIFFHNKTNDENNVFKISDIRGLTE